MVLPTSKVARKLLANQRYGINRALSKCGVYTDSDGFRSRKLHCPFGGVFHSDGGESAAFRAYPDTETGYCFACGKFFTPAILISQSEDITEDEAVDVMLMELGYTEAEDAPLVVETAEPEADKQAFAQAFQMFVARKIPDYGTRQYDSDVATWVDRCLAIVESVATIEEAELWLSTAKRATEQKFRKEEQ